jgi:hypothetical protein
MVYRTETETQPTFWLDVWLEGGGSMRWRVDADGAAIARRYLDDAIEHRYASRPDVLRFDNGNIVIRAGAVIAFRISSYEVPSQTKMVQLVQAVLAHDQSGDEWKGD